MITGIKEELSYEIKKLTETYNMSFLEATLAYCEQNSHDESLIGSIISKNPFLFSKIEEEAEQLNFLQKKDRIPNV